MKNILILLFLAAPLLLFSQTEIPYPAFFSEIQDVAGAGQDKYNLTLTVNDLSGGYNGNSITTDNFVLWQNCGRYVIDSVLLQFPSQVIVRVHDTEGDGSPILGFCSILEETPVLGLGFYAAGILDSRNQCALSYYAKRQDLGAASTDGVVYNGIYYKSFTGDFTLELDTLAKYDRLVFYGSMQNLTLPTLSFGDTTYNGKKIEVIPNFETGIERDIVMAVGGSPRIVAFCGGVRDLTVSDTVTFDGGIKIEYHIVGNDRYYRVCDEEGDNYELYYGNDLLASGDTVPVPDTYELYYGDTLLVSGDTIPVSEEEILYRYESTDGSTNAHIAANGIGITVTENSGAGQLTVSIPKNIEILYLTLFLPSSVTSSGDYHVVFDYEGLRDFNTSKINMQVPLVRAGLDNFATASRGNPVNISENGGNTANTVIYGVSEFSGGAGSDMTITLQNFSLGINQFVRFDFSQIK